MKKLLFLASLMVLCLPLAASAQEVAPKVEIFGGYSFLRVDLGAIPTDIVPSGGSLGNLDTHGFNVSFAGNPARHFGIISEVSQYTKTESFNILGSPLPGGVNVKFRVLTLLFGPRVTLHRGKVEPFVHGLFGAARATAEAPDLGVSAGDPAYAFAYALGGGFAAKVQNDPAFRLGQADYLGAGPTGHGSRGGDCRRQLGDHCGVAARADPINLHPQAGRRDDQRRGLLAVRNLPAQRIAQRQ